MDEGPNQHRIKLDTLIQAHIESVWAVLTDYNHHAEILPYLSKSIVLSSAPLTVQQIGKIRVLFWTFTMHATQQIQEAPPVGMRFQAIAGDFKRLEGAWTLTMAGSTTRLTCDFLVEPIRKVPAWAVRMAARRYLTKMVGSLQEQAEKL